MSKIRVSEAWIGDDKDHLEHSLCFEFTYIKPIEDTLTNDDVYQAANVAIYYLRTSKKWLGEIVIGEDYSSFSEVETMTFVKEWDLESLAKAWADMHLQ